MTFVPLASSSVGNAYVVTDGDARLGIEAGLAWKQYQRLMNYRVSTLDGVIVSHCHGDHAKAAKDVMRAAVNVYSSAETFEALGLSGRHRAISVEPLTEFTVGPWRVLPFPAVHDAPGPLGFMVQGPSGGRMLYLTDSAYCEYRFEGLEIVAIEANYSESIMHDRVMKGSLDKLVAVRTIRNHMSLERCVQLLTANDLTRVREIHLLHLSDGNSDERAFKETVERATGVPTYVAAAGAVA